MATVGRMTRGIRERAQQAATLGHLPQSIEISTVGGWLAVAARPTQPPTQAEDIVVGLKAGQPDGNAVEFGRWRALGRPSIRD